MFILFTLTHMRRKAQPPGGDKFCGSAEALPLLAGRKNQFTVTVASALVLVTPVASVITQR